MEVISFSVLSVLLVNVLGIASYICYKRYRASLTSQDASQQSSKTEDSKSDSSKGKQKKAEAKQKAKQKKTHPQHQKKKTPATENLSDTESFTTEEQLAQTIISQHQFSQDSINTSAVNAKPTVKKTAPTQRSNSRSRKGSTNEKVTERDPNWEKVIAQRHKKKLYPTVKQGEKFEFTLDDDGGIVELPFCELNFPSESVLKSLHIGVEEEVYKKFVDDTEEKVFVTPAIHFTRSHETKLRRQFMIKLNTLKMMGRGWNGNACCQIEKKVSDNTWVTTARTEYVFGKPVQFVGDDLSSFRAVITRGQNGAITRDLRIAAYIARPKVQNPSSHSVHLCIYDRSQQSQFKAESNMQQFLMKMEPRICNVQFGCDLQFKIQPSKKFTPELKDVFIRWTEVCKAFVNVKFQIRINRNELEDPTLETDYHTSVFINISKVSATLTTLQEEYFRFYWVSSTLFPKKKAKGRKVKGQALENPGSGAHTTPQTKTLQDPSKSGARVSKPPLSPNNGFITRKDDRKTGSKRPQPPKPTGPHKAKVPINNLLSLPKPQPSKSGLPPTKASNSTQSRSVKSRNRRSKKKAASLKNDNYTLNILNDLEKVKAQVQSMFPPTVLPGTGASQTKPQKSSMRENAAKKQSIPQKSQEVISSQKPATGGDKPTVNMPQGPTNAPVASSARTPKDTGRSPKKSRRSDQQNKSKGDPSNQHISRTANNQERGSGDGLKGGTFRQEQRRPGVAAPGGGDNAFTPKSKDLQGHEQGLRLNGTLPKQPSDVSKEPQQRSRQSRGQNQQVMNNSNDSRSKSPKKLKTNPKPRVATQKPHLYQNGQTPVSLTPKNNATTPNSQGVVKLTNGHTNNIDSTEKHVASSGYAMDGRDIVANQAPKDRRPRRPRDRQRGPASNSQPQPHIIQSEAS